MTPNFEYKKQPLQTIDLIGKGKGGYSYLVTDGTTHYVAKKIHHEPCEHYDFGDQKFELELTAYRTLQQLPIRIPELLEVNLEEEYLIKEYIEGELVSDLAARGELTTDHFIQAFMFSESIRKEGFNLDYFPTNFVISGNTFFYIDYEINRYMTEWDFTHWGIYYWLNEEGMKHYNNHRSFDVLHPTSADSKPRTLGFESHVAELKALYQKYIQQQH